MDQVFDPQAISIWRQEVISLREKREKLTEQLRQAVPLNFIKWLEAAEFNPNKYVNDIINNLFLFGFSQHGFTQDDWEKFGSKGWKKLFQYFTELGTAWQGIVEMKTTAEGELFKDRGYVTVEILIPNSPVKALSL
jgi:hypothetical protein